MQNKGFIGWYFKHQKGNNTIAFIPGMADNGCICAIMHNNREYRFATYKGVRIHAAQANHICLSQGKLFLEINIKPAHIGQPLNSPVMGKMSGIVHESTNAYTRIRLWKAGKQIFDISSNNAAYEFVPFIR